MSERIRKLTTAAAVGFAVFALLFYWSETMVLWYRMPQTGAVVNAEDRGYRVVSVRSGSPAALAGLRSGDLVLSSLLGYDNADLLFSGDPVPPQKIHASSVTAERGTQRLKISVVPASSPHPAVYGIPIIARLLAYSLFVILGAWIVCIRPGLMSFALFAVCLGSIPPQGDTRAVYESYIVPGTLAYNAFIAFDLGITELAHFMPIFLLRFPNDRSDGWKGVLLPYCLFLLPPYAIVEALLLGFTPYDVWRVWDPILGYIGDTLDAAWLAIVVVSYCQARGTERQRLKWAIAGISIGILGFAGNVFSREITHQSNMGVVIGDAFTVISVAMPICLVYAIVRHRVIDVRFVIGRTIIFGTGIALMGALFIALDVTFSRYITQSRWQIAVAAAVAFLFGWTLRHLRGRLAELIDRILFPKHYVAMDALRELRFVIETEERITEVQRVLVDSASGALGLSSAAFFAKLPDRGLLRERTMGWPAGTAWHLLADDRIVQRLAAGRCGAMRLDESASVDLNLPHGVARPVLAIPLRSHKGIAALAFYGAHADGSDIDPDEASSLIALCAAAPPSAS